MFPSRGISTFIRLGGDRPQRFVIAPPFAVAFEPEDAPPKTDSGVLMPQTGATNTVAHCVGNCGQKRRSETVLGSFDDWFSKTGPSFKIPPRGKSYFSMNFPNLMRVSS